MAALLISSNVPSIADGLRGGSVRKAAQLHQWQPGEGILPVHRALRPLLPAGGLAKGSVVTVESCGMLCVALMAGASAAGAWCAVAGVPEFGAAAAAAAGADLDRMLLVPDPGERWPQVVSWLLEGCELVIVRPPGAPAARARQRIEAVLRRCSGVLLVAGEWEGAAVRLRVGRQRWSGLGDGHGRLQACRAEVSAAGRGAAGRPRREMLWLPAADGTIAAADPAENLPGRQSGPAAETRIAG